MPRPLLTSLLLFAIAPLAIAADDPWLHFAPGNAALGQGKKIVLISGDEEYRSEEALPALGKILAERHGFDCTVLFAIDKKDGCIQPNVNDNIPGLEKLKDADLMVIFTRFRNLPDEQMKHVVDYLEAGKPVVGFRTATHAFSLKSKTYAKYSSNSREKGFEGGFGRAILGEDWVNHHGGHGSQGTRGIVVADQKTHPILKGIEPGSIFGTTDVYTVNLPLPGDCKPLVLGEVTETLKADSKGISGKKNDPMMPVAWTKTYSVTAGNKGRVFTTTLGASQDFEFEGTRRMIVNGCLWALGLDEKIPQKTDVAFVGEFKASPFKGKKNEDWKPGKKPSELKSEWQVFVAANSNQQPSKPAIPCDFGSPAGTNLSGLHYGIQPQYLSSQEGFARHVDVMGYNCSSGTGVSNCGIFRTMCRNTCATRITYGPLRMTFFHPFRRN